MTCPTLAEGTIELYFYGELEEGPRAAVETHLRRCPECRTAWEELGVISAALAGERRVTAPPGGDWSGFMTRLERTLAAEGTAVPTARPVAAEPMAARQPRAAFWACAAAAAALILATAAGLAPMLRERSGSETAPRAEAPAVRDHAGPPQPDPALVRVSDQHFERSKLVVLGVTTRDADAGVTDWGHEREMASTLLSDTRLYRQAAEARGMPALAGVMADLELVLLHVAMAEAPDRESLERMQRLIRRRDLLTKMNAGYMAASTAY